MGMDYIANLGYGFMVLKDHPLFEDGSDDVIEVLEKDKGLSKKIGYMFHGSDYDGSNSLFFVIKKSYSQAYAYGTPLIINQAKFIKDDAWDNDLLELVKKLNIKKPKIGWYLCSNVG